MLNTYFLQLASASTQYAKKESPTAALQITGDLTLRAFVKFSSLPAADTESAIVSLRTTDGGKTCFYFCLRDTSGSTYLRFFHRNNSSQTDIVDKAWSPSLNTWYEVAVSISGTTVKIFARTMGSNFSQIGTDATLVNSRQFVSGQVFLIGSLSSDGVQLYNGKIDEVVVYNAALTLSQLNATLDYDQTDESGVQGYWKFNNSYVDEKGANDLTAVNSPTFGNTDKPFEYYPNTTTAPVVTTDSITDIQSNSATANGNVTDDGGATVTERGFVYGLDPNPTTADNKKIVSGTTGSYSGEITGLATLQTYHVRAYAINAVGTSYGDDLDFTTRGEYLQPNPKIPTGYHCFISNFVKNMLAGFTPIITPDGINRAW